MTNPLKIYRDVGDTTVEIIPEVKKEDFTSTMEGEIAHFIKCVREEKEPSSSGEKGLRVMRLLDGIYESARIGKEVRIG